jgi:hypothetical protein
MKLGSEDKKKVIALSVLGGVAAIVLYVNFFSDSSPTPTAPRKAATALDPAVATSPVAPASTSTQPKPLITSRGSKGEEFHPALHPKNRTGEQAINLNEVDPTLHTEMLAKVREVKLEGGQRNLFQFGAAEVPAALKGPEPVITAMGKPYIFPKPVPPEVKPGPVVEPPPPPPSFKYYGLATKRIDNKKTAFFLDGEDIILATEGMTIKTRWRLIRINTDSVTLEDTQNKKQQPLAISEDVGGTF